MAFFTKRARKRINRFGIVTCVWALICCQLSFGATLAAGQDHARSATFYMETDPSAAMLEAGFRELYELDFVDARVQFHSYEQRYPNDPMGKTAEAASYLYEELNAKGVFSSAFFIDDAKLLGGVNGTLSENRNEGFLRANRRAREMAQQKLRLNPRDARALLALTLTEGMESDYAALIEKRQLASLTMIRRAERDADNLLAVEPSAGDAYVALGLSNYIIGCLPRYKRAVLWLGGFHGDRKRGIKQLQFAAEHGRYLKPFAKILLALVFEREHQPERSRPILSDLAHEFPANPLFARELALLDQRTAGKN